MEWRNAQNILNKTRNIRNILKSGPAEQFSKCGGRSTPFEVQLGFGGGLDFKNGLPGADSIFFNTVTTHQSFFLIVYQTRKELVTKKYNHAQQQHNFRVSFTSRIVRSLLSAVQNLSLVIVERSHVCNLRAAEKDLFLLRWLQDLPAEVCRSGKLAISFIMLCRGS